ncbi:MAG: lipocalin-like domain-containing protein [Dysgonamonadaceae bacterium]|nr:lipocalin-like domain-containing protein [Dysgonamonadaceae bacterium]
MKLKLFFMICSVFFFSSCDKIFLDVEGKDADLQGKWQMDNADTVYFNFQNNLFLYQIYRVKNQMSGVYGYYILQGDTTIDIQLLRTQASFSLDYLGWDTIYSSNGNDTIHKLFKIKKLTSKKLILSSDREDISFHKF